MDRVILDNSRGKRHIHIRDTRRGDTTTKSKRVPIESIRGDHTLESLHKRYGPHAARRRPTLWRIVLGRGAHDVINSGLYINVINVYYL